MTRERVTRYFFILLICVTAACVLAGSKPGAIEGAQVLLQNGERLQGKLRAVQPSLYLLQSGDHLYELSGDEIKSVDGRSELPGFGGGERLIFSDSYEELLPGGDVETWSTLRTRNEGGKAWTYTSWGVAPWELERVERMLAVDKYGNRLEHRLVPREGSEIQDIIVDLAVPVVPGEELNLALRYRDSGRCSEEKGIFTYSFQGDFPEDRVHLRKVKLPRGARIESVEPEPSLRFEDEGSTVLVWRRYYAKGEILPQTIRYRLD